MSTGSETTYPKTLKIGTRGSPLALKQVDLVVEALKAAHPALLTETIIIKTSGDWKPEDGEQRLSEKEGGKGLFAKEIEAALLAGEIDCAVHSLKDMPAFLPPGLGLDHVLKRDDPRDAFICHTVSDFMDLPPGATVGTSSLRRQAFMLARRPDLKVVPLRGNVQTRLQKLKDGQVDATFLAMAGLNRLGIQGDFIHPIDPSVMPPSCGQGVISVETRTDDAATRRLMDALHCAETQACALAEREALKVLDGSCHTPIGAFAYIDLDRIVFEVSVAYGNGSAIYNEMLNIKEYQDLEGLRIKIQNVSKILKDRVPPDIFL